MIRKILLPLLLIIVLSACTFNEENLGSTEASKTDVVVDTSEIAADEPVQDNEVENEKLQGQVSESDDSSLPADVEPFPEPNPLDLAITLDNAHAVENEIGPEGGTLDLTTPAGVNFSLEIPENALLTSEIIRMTPAVSVEGIAIDNQNIPAVSLEPSGVVFFSPVNLHISGLPTRSEELPIGFGTMAEGKDFHLQLTQIDEEEVTLYLSNFSNYGIVLARTEEIGRLRENYTPSDAQHQSGDNIAQILALIDEKEARLGAYERIFNQWFYNSVLVRINNAGVFDDRLDYAVAEFLAWKHNVETLDFLEGFDGELTTRLRDQLDEGLDALAQSFANAFEKTYSRCVSNNDPEQAFRFYRYGLTASYLRLWDRDIMDEEEIKAKLSECFQFEFLFRSRIEAPTEGLTKISVVMARIPLKIDGPNSFDISGSILTQRGALTYEDNRAIGLPGFCKLGSDPGTMGVSIIFRMNYNRHNPWHIEEVNTLMIFPEGPSAWTECTEAGVTVKSEIPLWRPLFHFVNQDFFDGPIMELSLPIVKKSDIFAETELFGPIPEWPNSKERTMYQLIHTPGN